MMFLAQLKRNGVMSNDYFLSGLSSSTTEAHGLDNNETKKGEVSATRIFGVRGRMGFCLYLSFGCVPRYAKSFVMVKVR